MNEKKANEILDHKYIVGPNSRYLTMNQANRVGEQYGAEKYLEAIEKVKGLVEFVEMIGKGMHNKPWFTMESRKILDKWEKEK